jgi:hypothetical protein
MSRILHSLSSILAALAIALVALGTASTGRSLVAQTFGPNPPNDNKPCDQQCVDQSNCYDGGYLVDCMIACGPCCGCAEPDNGGGGCECVE